MTFLYLKANQLKQIWKQYKWLQYIQISSICTWFIFLFDDSYQSIRLSWTNQYSIIAIFPNSPNPPSSGSLLWRSEVRIACYKKWRCYIFQQNFLFILEWPTYIFLKIVFRSTVFLDCKIIVLKYNKPHLQVHFSGSNVPTSKVHSIFLCL